MNHNSVLRNHGPLGAPLIGLWALLLLISVPPAFADGAISNAIGTLLDSTRGVVAKLNNRTEVRRFYSRRENQPAWWTAEYGLSLQVHELLEGVRSAPVDGLIPQDYHLVELEREIERKSRDPHALASLDILLTDAFLSFASELRSGRVDPRSIDPDWDIRTNRYQMSEVLEYALENHAISEVLRDMPPFQQGYYDLRDALARYQALAAQGGWPTIPDGPTLREGDSDARVLELRRRLALSGDLPSAMPPEQADLFDSSLSEGLRHFQQRHGLPADGVLGKGTLKELNVPVAERIRTLRVNLERWRWLPRGYMERYLLVNLTDFSMRVVENGRPVLAMKVIIGRTDRQTPVLSSQIDALVLNPNWYVPKSIFRRDILPKLVSDPDYLKRKQITLLAHDGSGSKGGAEIDWSQVDARRFPYTLRQNPGEQNALGQVKFTFPNRHEVYLHDTPSKELFAKPVRTFSSGCIRLEKPLQLVDYLLRDEPEWSMQRAQEQLAGGGNRRLSLSRPLPVFLFYWTAWVDADGRINFRDDIYRRDRRLIEVLGRRDGRIALTSLQ